MCRPILKIYQLCALLSLLVIRCLIVILLAVQNGSGSEWEYRMYGNGNKTRLNLGVGIGMRINYNWEREEMGLKDILPLISFRSRLSSSVTS